MQNVNFSDQVRNLHLRVESGKCSIGDELRRF